MTVTGQDATRYDELDAFLPHDKRPRILRNKSRRRRPTSKRVRIAAAASAYTQKKHLYTSLMTRVLRCTHALAQNCASHTYIRTYVSWLATTKNSWQPPLKAAHLLYVPKPQCTFRGTHRNIRALAMCVCVCVWIISDVIVLALDSYAWAFFVLFFGFRIFCILIFIYFFIFFKWHN